MLGSSWVAAQVAASQEGLSSMSEWVNPCRFLAGSSGLGSQLFRTPGCRNVLPAQDSEWALCFRFKSSSDSGETAEAFERQRSLDCYDISSGSQRSGRKDSVQLYSALACHTVQRSIITRRDQTGATDDPDDIRLETSSLSSTVVGGLHWLLKYRLAE
jgi:hypothetical protein